MPINHRSGRFNKNAENATLVDGRANVFYRVFNSAPFDPDHPTTNQISVKYGNGNGKSVMLLPTFSVDVFLENTLEVNGLQVVQGMYDVLSESAEVRSGRFKTRGQMNKADLIPVVVGPSGKFAGVYRVFNSGDSDFQLVAKKGNGAATNIGDPIEPNQSMDFVSHKNEDVFVKATDSTKYIEGIYEFIKEVHLP